MPIRIERARSTDFEDLGQLLTQNQLPLDGLSQHMETALVAREGDRLIGSAALEVYADGALLRSVAVARDFQGRGIGHTLTTEAIQLARDLRVSTLFLLTTTAETFFPKFGFERIARGDVPLGVQASVEFSSACPASAAVMRKLLSPPSAPTA